MTQHGAQPWAGQYGSVHSVPSLDRLGGRGGGGGGGALGTTDQRSSSVFAVEGN